MKVRNGCVLFARSSRERNSQRYCNGKSATMAAACSIPSLDRFGFGKLNPDAAMEVC